MYVFFFLQIEIESESSQVFTFVSFAVRSSLRTRPTAEEKFTTSTCAVFSSI